MKREEMDEYRQKLLDEYRRKLRLVRNLERRLDDALENGEQFTAAAEDVDIVTWSLRQTEGLIELLLKEEEKENA